MNTQEQDVIDITHKETDRQNSNLIEYHKVENTPFQVVSVEKEVTTEHYVMFGKYRISEAIESKEEAIEEAEKLDWWKIMSVAHAIAESIVKTELNKTQENE